MMNNYLNKLISNFFRFIKNFFLQTIPFVIFLFAAFIIYLSVGCEKDFSSIEVGAEMSLEIQYIGITSIQLKLFIPENLKVRRFSIKRDELEIYTGFLKSTDTTISDINLYPSENYSYKAYLVHQNKYIDSTSILQVATKDTNWYSLGPVNKPALRLHLSDPYLFISEYKEGIWRKNIRQTGSSWEYVGMAVDDIGKPGDYGIEDFIIHQEHTTWILAAFHSVNASDHKVYRSLDDGLSWTSADSGLAFYYNGYKVIATIYRFIQCSDKILAAGHGVFKTTNFGEKWEVTGDSLQIGAETLWAFEKHPVWQDILWAGGESIITDPILGYSTNAGSTWTRVNLQHIVPSLNGVRSAAFNPNDPNAAYIGLGTDIIKTTDLGQTWDIIYDKGSRSLLIDPTNYSHIWATTNDGLIESWDEGQTWNIIQTPPQVSGVYDMIWDDQRKVIYIGTLNNGVYYYKPSLLVAFPD